MYASGERGLKLRQDADGSVERRRRRKEISRVLSRAEALGSSIWDDGHPTPRAAYPSSYAADRRSLCSALLLVGFVVPRPSPARAVGSYPTVSPLPVHRIAGAIGGLFSVTLSIASRRPGVTRHHVLRSPDFPRPADSRPRPRFLPPRRRLARVIITSTTSRQYNGVPGPRFPDLDETRWAGRPSCRARLARLASAAGGRLG